MENVLLVVHIITCIALIGVVLLQRSEGGALGIGGGGGGGLMSGRGAASTLTRVTMLLGAVFLATTLTLTTIATRSNAADSTIAGEIERSESDDLLLPTDDLDIDAGSIDVDVTPEETVVSTPDEAATDDVAEPEVTPPSEEDGSPQQ